MQLLIVSTRMSLRETIRKTKPFYLVKYMQDATYDIIREEDLLINEDLHEGAKNKVMCKKEIYIMEIVKIG